MHEHKTEIFNFPKHIDLELNTQCNLTCSMCNRTGFKNGVMNINNAKKIIKYCADNGTETIKHFWRGEATLNKDYPEILKYSKECGLKNMLNTNGFNVTTEIIESLDWISFSIDKEHKNNNEETKRKVLKAKELGKYVEIQSGSPDTDIQLFSQIYGIPLKIDCFTKRTDNQNYEYLNLEEYPRKNCKHPFFRMVITHDLKVKPCCMPWKDGELDMGTIDINNLNSIKDIWGGFGFQLIRKMQESLTFTDMCANCKSQSAYEVKK